MSETLNARNIRALHEAAKHQQKRVDDLFERVILLERNNALLRDAYNDLRSQLASQHARVAMMQGAGPTKR